LTQKDFLSTPLKKRAVSLSHLDSNSRVHSMCAQ
jgi:hypothetical protein